MEMLSRRKVRKILKPKEVVTVGEFIKRYTGDTMSPMGMDLWFTIYIRNSNYLLVHDEKYPITVERKK